MKNLISKHGLLELTHNGYFYSLDYYMTNIAVSRDKEKLLKDFKRRVTACYCHSLPGSPCDFCTGLRNPQQEE